jgi:hypothetical protein
LGVSGFTLTNFCRWASSDAKNDDKFPKDKQFLITRKVPCLKRIKELEDAASGIQEVDLGDGWVEATGGETVQ